MLSFCAIYALRGIEVRHLMLSDFDWVNETFVVGRAKGGPIQQFPLQYEVGQAVLRYLRYGRPKCYNRELFVTLKPPYRPMNQCVMAALVRTRMQVLKVESLRCGTHSLRHACATELLRRGSSLVEIADFLGHRSIESVSIYARLDNRSLRRVATFSLAGVR
jgi:integrase/recombinase XerD